MKLSEIIKRYELGLIDFEQFVTEFEQEAKTEERERILKIIHNSREDCKKHFVPS